MNGRHSRTVRRTLALALTAKPAAVGLVALSPQVASAAGTTVTCTGNNATDVAALKAAIVAANMVPSSTITLNSSCVFTLTAANSPGSADGLPIISKKLVIEGNGATITRSTNLATPRFRILHVAFTGNLTLRHTTISNGSLLGVGGGGGIDSQGILAVEHSTITRNRVTGNDNFSAGVGGGIRSSAILTVTDSVISANKVIATTLTPGNSGFATGGGISAKGKKLVIRNSTVSGNSVSATAAGGTSTANAQGAGIALSTSPGQPFTTSISASTISGNIASASNTGAGTAVSTGGAIESSTFSIEKLTTSVINSTLAENSVTSTTAAGNTGAAISARGSAGATLDLVNTTVALNAGSGGAIEHPGRAGSVSLTSTIVSNNLPGQNCAGTIIDGGGNLSFPADGTCTAFGHGDPALGPLQNNGGPTETMALGTGSAAIDTAFAIPCSQAEPAGAAGIDQRGLPRMEVLADPKCDIGAFEVQPVVAVVVPAPTPALPKAGTEGPGRGSGLPWPLLIPAAVASGVLGAAGRRLRGRPKS